MGSSLPPLYAPGFHGRNAHTTRHKKRAALIVTSIWLTLAAASSVLFEQLDPTFLQRMGFLSLQLLVFLLLTTGVVLSDRFAQGMFPYGLTAFGEKRRVDTYRYLGGVPMFGRRVVTERDYHECAECGTELYDGVLEDSFAHLTAFGLPLVKRSETRKYYCTTCRADQWGTPDIEMPLIDLKDPDNSTEDEMFPELQARLDERESEEGSEETPREE